MAGVLVSGATGRLGKALVARLLERGWDVRAVVRPGREGSLPPMVQKVEHDLSVAPLPASAFEGMANAAHLAGLVGDHPYEKLYLHNAVGTKNFLSACPSNIRTVVASSIAVYGRHEGQVVDESFEPKPDTPYGKSKLMAERFACQCSDRSPVVLLRFGMIYGPGFYEGYFPVLSALEKGRMKILGSGKNRIPLVYVDDAVEAILLSFSARVASGEKYNIVGPDTLTQEELLAIAAQELGVGAPSDRISPAIASLAATCAGWLSAAGICKKPQLNAEHIRQMATDRAYSCEKARRELGFVPAVGAREGIARMVRFYKQRKD
ncbi:MAG: NAD-dependent epimerase/dehydratase family protein [Candidatus Micrarchaeota archaeon]|nr:NAD-dependent epimerase/dehydratase family protein [Candidatus Micrarchaeota archaeon]